MRQCSASGVFKPTVSRSLIHTLPKALHLSSVPRIRGRRISMFERIEHEAAPVVRHAIVTIALLTAFAAVGLLLRGIAQPFSSHAATFQLLETIDICFMVTLFCLFAAYTLALVAVCLWQSLRFEITHSRRSTPPRRAEAPE